MHILLIICFILMYPVMAIGENIDDNRRNYVYGTGNNIGGSVNTYVDRQTGDIVTSIVPPNDDTPYHQQGYGQSFPIYIYPEVTPTWPAKPNARPNTLNRPKPNLRPSMNNLQSPYTGVK